MSALGFTLLELVVVIVIVAVLVTLAIPRFINLIHKTRATEAIMALGSIHKAIERCRLWGKESDGFCVCTPNVTLWNPKGWGALDIDNPANAPGSRFTYQVFSCTADHYHLRAYYNDGGAWDFIHAIYDTSPVNSFCFGGICSTATGTGLFFRGSGVFDGLDIHN